MNKLPEWLSDEMEKLCWCSEPIMDCPHPHNEAIREGFQACYELISKEIRPLIKELNDHNDGCVEYYCCSGYVCQHHEKAFEKMGCDD